MHHDASAAPAIASVATDAAYWHAALSIGVHDIDDAKDWAFDVVAREENPDIRIIEVATARERNEGVAALSALIAGANTKEAATRLFRLVRTRLAADALTVEEAVALSVRICKVLALPFETCHSFDRVEHMLALSAHDLESNRPAIRNILLVTLETPYQ